MGVDISTYRCHIGTFHHGCGSDVVLLHVCLNYNGCMKIIGTVTFIGILLLMAGIEANPGPLDTDDRGEDVIRSILSQIGLDSHTIDKYALIFKENMIGVNEVEYVAIEDFSNMGIPIGIRIRIQKACKQYVKDRLPVSTVVPPTSIVPNPSLTKGDDEKHNYETINSSEESKGETVVKWPSLNDTVDSNNGKQQVKQEDTSVLSRRRQRPPVAPKPKVKGGRQSCGNLNDKTEHVQFARQLSACLQFPKGIVKENVADKRDEIPTVDPDCGDSQETREIPELTTASDKREQEKINEAENVYKKEGHIGVLKYLNFKLNEWKDEPFKIGVTGSSGTGKSTFINAIRGLTSEDKGAAKTGVTETTLQFTEYPHPKNKNLILYDLPGAGTPNFPREHFFKDNKRVRFEQYDFFIIIACSRFTQDDLWLAKEIFSRQKRFIFIRTKIDQDIANLKRSNPTYFRQTPKAHEIKVKEIRDDCEKHLKELQVGKKQLVYLIDSFAIDNPLYDFDKLLKRILENLSDLKKEAFVYSMTTMTPKMIVAKEAALKDRFVRKAALAALGGTFTSQLPSVSSRIDVGIIVDEATFYAEQMSLDQTSLKNLFQTKDIKPSDLLLESSKIVYTPEGIASYFANELEETIGGRIFRMIPFLGNVINGTQSYQRTKAILSRLLTIMVSDAKKVYEYVQNLQHEMS